MESESLPSFAVSTAVWVELILPLFTTKLAEIAPEGTVTREGFLNSEFVLERPTETPEAGAAVFNVTTHVELVRLVRVSGVQVSRLSPTKATVTDPDELFRVAVMVA